MCRDMTVTLIDYIYYHGEVPVPQYERTMVIDENYEYKFSKVPPISVNKVLKKEEGRFLETLDQGMKILETSIFNLKNKETST